MQKDPFSKLGAIDQKLFQALPKDREQAQPEKKQAGKQSASLLANQQTSKEVNQQVSELANLQISKEVNQQTSKTLRKFGSYLRAESLKQIKQIATETDRKDYEVLQEAVDQYLASKQTSLLANQQTSE